MSIAKLTALYEKMFSPAGALKTLTIDEDAFVQGKAFTHSNYTTGVATSAIINYLFDPTACTCDNLVAQVPSFTATAGPILIEYFVGGTVSANGTEMVSFNRRSGGAPAEGKLYVAPTITADGVRIAGQLVPASAAVQGDNGASTEKGLPFELDKTLLMIIRLTNTNGDDVSISHTFDWIEA